MRFFIPAAICCGFLSTCTFLLDHESKQCSVDADCKRFGDAVCVDTVCVLATTTDAGDAGGTVSDAGALGPPGCFRGTPSTDLEFANRCTNASFLVFDNCARLGACDGGMEPSLSKPDAGTSTVTTPVDGGPTVGCYDATDRPNVIFMNGSTNFTPFIRVMVPIVAQSGYTIVWQPTSSCTGADTIFNTDQARRVMRNPTNTGQTVASFYTMSNLPNGTPCSLGNSPTAPSATSEYVDIGQSDIFAASCPPTSTAPFNTYEPETGAFADVRHYLGPVQSMVFVTPANSAQRVISAEAARLVFGLGGNSPAVSPWNDRNSIWIRSPTTGTAGIISRGIGVPATDLWGIDQRTAPNMVAQLKSTSTSSSERTIAMLSIDFADRERDNINILYFQPRGALAGYLPDSHPFTRDKENVRDGHYPLWGPVHLYARATGGDISNAAKAFITQFSVPHPDTALLDATIETGNVPTCAMKVTRTTEMGPLKAYEAPFQCHCYYEKKLNGGNSCKACAGPAECPSDRPRCNLGYCEKQ